MGRERREIKVVTFVSRHNSERDVEDDALTDELFEKIRQLAGEDHWRSVSPMVFD